MNVVPFPTTSMMDVPAMLRNLADAIEAGEHGDVTTAIVLVPNDGDRPALFGFGEDTDPASVIFELQLANQFLLMNLVSR